MRTQQLPVLNGGSAQDRRRIRDHSIEGIGDLRQQLRQALQELNMTRVTQILAPLRDSQAELLNMIDHMLAQHQYPQLCAMIDSIEGELS